VGISQYAYFSTVGYFFAANFIQNLYTVLKKRLWESCSTPTLVTFHRTGLKMELPSLEPAEHSLLAAKNLLSNYQHYYLTNLRLALFPAKVFKIMESCLLLVQTLITRSCLDRVKLIFSSIFFS
jgi:hypothetical protein